MLKVLRIPSFALLWSGQFISMMGDWVLMTALPFYVYRATGSVMATGLMFMVQVVPRLLVGPVAGVFVDRWDHRRTMIVNDLLRAVVVLTMLLVPVSGMVWIVYVAGFLESLFSLFFLPANRAFVPTLVAVDQLTSANSLSAVGESLARIVGPSLGGVLLSLLGLPVVVLIDAASYVVSGLLIAAIRAPATHRVAPDPGTGAQVEGASALTKWKDIWRDLLAGLQLIRSDRAMLSVFAMVGLATLADSMLSPLIVPLVEQVLRGGPEELGWLMTARGLGGLVGALLIGQLGERVQRRGTIIAGMAVTGLLVGVVVNFPILILSLAALALLGIPVMAWVIPTETILQARTPERLRGRVFSAYGTIAAITMLVGMGFAGVVAERIGVVTTLNVSVGIYLVAAATGWILMPKALTRRVDPRLQEMAQ